ncbi:MAG: ferritin [Bacteroidia bacterium]|nr:ferritin [Bacteroidia bacterium]
MKISDKLHEMLNEQIANELYSCNLYLSMASYFLDLELNGFANFFLVQVEEENFHAMRQFKYLHDVDGKLILRAIEAPQTGFKSIKNVFEITMEHEKKVTKSINKMIQQAVKENDFATHTFLQWFVTEQVEEEATVKNILKKIEMVADNSSALYLLNEELSRRTFQKPAL